MRPCCLKYVVLPALGLWCDHMSAVGHLQHFCWLCGAATGISHTWTNIQGHSCGRFKDEAELRAESAARCALVCQPVSSPEHVDVCETCNRGDVYHHSMLHSFYNLC